MIGRTALDNCHWDNLVSIIEDKSQPLRGRLVALDNKLARAFADYEEHFDRLLLAELPVRKWSSQQKADLLACYSGKTAALSRLKSDIELAQGVQLEGFCPFCGVAKAEEFDHYAPKERFPHVAVHALNLVPCCGRCNRVKTKAWLGDDDQRQVLHFYLDDIPDEQFLFADIDWEVVGATPIPRATYSIKRPRGFSTRKFGLIERHFQTIKLFSHYQRNTHHCISELVRAVRLSRPKSRAAVNHLLNTFTDDNGRIFGRSYWKVVLADALKGDAAFAAMAMA